MKDENIKEILDDLKFAKNEKDCDYILFPEKASLLLSYITNLQEENEELREDNFAYHQLMKMQNQREYRSKFLKDFQKEHGRNVFPDYDEIYKKYDNYKTRNEEATNYLLDKYVTGKLDDEEVNNVVRILKGE